MKLLDEKPKNNADRFTRQENEYYYQKRFNKALTEYKKALSIKERKSPDSLDLLSRIVLLDWFIIIRVN